MPLLPVNKRKVLRRRVHVLLLALVPEAGVQGSEELERLVAHAGLESAVSVLREPAALRESGLPKSADLLAPWWQSLPPASRWQARLPQDVTQAALAEPAVCAEIVSFVVREGLLSHKVLRLLRDSPDEMARLLSARAKEADERAKREIPRLLQELKQIAREALRFLKPPDQNGVDD